MVTLAGMGMVSFFTIRQWIYLLCNADQRERERETEREGWMNAGREAGRDAGREGDLLMSGVRGLRRWHIITAHVWGFCHGHSIPMLQHWGVRWR